VPPQRATVPQFPLAALQGLDQPAISSGLRRCTVCRAADVALLQTKPASTETPFLVFGDIGRNLGKIAQNWAKSGEVHR